MMIAGPTLLEEPDEKQRWDLSVRVERRILLYRIPMQKHIVVEGEMEIKDV